MKPSVAYVASAAIVVTLFTGCGATPSSAASPSVAPTASTAPTASPHPATPAFPDAMQVEPAAIIDMAGTSGAIALASDGQTVWAAADGALLRIDAKTIAVERLEAPVQPDDTTLTIADDGLWATRWGGGRLYRLDPETGEVLLEVEMPKAVRVAFIGKDLWVGREDEGSMARVDRVTGEVLSPIVSQGAYGVSGAGDLWFAYGSLLKVVRVDPATGDEKARIDFPGETNCGISGSFPDDAWTACFGRDVIARSVARIDPATNTMAAAVTLPPTHGGAVIVIEGRPWFIGTFEGSDGEPFAGILRINPETRTIDTFFSLAGADPDTSVISTDALWVPDEAGRRILKIDFADLTD